MRLMSINKIRIFFNFFSRTPVFNACSLNTRISPSIFSYVTCFFYSVKKFFNFNFYLNNCPINYCDVSIMSGTYNYAVTDNIESWESYVIHNLSECLKKSRLGIAFNLQFEKKRNIRNNIYYTNVQYMLSLLKRNFIKIEKYYTYTSSKDIYFLIYKN